MYSALAISSVVVTFRLHASMYSARYTCRICFYIHVSLSTYILVSVHLVYARGRRGNDRLRQADRGPEPLFVYFDGLTIFCIYWKQQHVDDVRLCVYVA